MLKTPLPKWQKTASETLNSLGFIQKKDTLTLPNLNSGFTIGKKKHTATYDQRASSA